MRLLTLVLATALCVLCVVQVFGLVEAVSEAVQVVRKARTPTGEPFDVVVFLIDDVAAEDLALYGGPVAMPYLEQLAGAGVTFTNSYADAWCAPTRRSLVFGRWWGNSNGVVCATTPTVHTPTAAEVSLAEALSAHSSAVIGKWHLGGTPTSGAWECAPIAHGFDLWVAGVAGNVGSGGCGVTNPDEWKWSNATATASGCSWTTSTTYHPIAVRDAFKVGWPSAPRPALAYVNSSLPHQPFTIPPASLLPVGYPTPITQRQKFEARLRAFDTTLGQMLAAVDLESTLIVVMGDNGTMPGAVPAAERERCKGSVYERGVRVPLIVAGGPTVAGGRTSSALVHAVDVYATAIEAGAGTVPSGSDSHSFLAVLTQTAFTPRQYVHLGDHWQNLTELPGERGVVSAGGWKLRQLDNDGNGTVDVEELYDLTNDPDETTSVLAGNPTIASTLRAWLAANAP